MPANPMGRGLPMASLVLPEEHAPEVSAEAGAAFLAVLETTQGKPVAISPVAPIGLAAAPASAPAIAPFGGDKLSDVVGEQLLASASPAIAPPIAPSGGDKLSDVVGEQLAASGPPASAPTVGDKLSDRAREQFVAPAAPVTAPAIAPLGGDKLSGPAGEQFAPPLVTSAASTVAPTQGDTLSAPAGDQLAPRADTLPASAFAPAPAPARPPRPRERAPAASTPVVAAPVAVDAAPLAPTPSEPPPVQAPDVAAHVARATEAADASSTSSIRAFGLRHVRLAVPSEDGAIRARLTVDRASETVDVAIRGTDDVGLTAARRVSELREGLAQHGLKLGVFDASAVTTDVARASTAEANPDLLQQAFDGSEHHPADRGSDRDGGPQGDLVGERAQTGAADSDEAPLHTEAPTRRAPNHWDDDATVGQLLDLRI
jgi:hypothetical protein